MVRPRSLVVLLAGAAAAALAALPAPPPAAAAAPPAVEGDWQVEARVVAADGAARPGEGTEVQRRWAALDCAAPCRVRLRERLPGGARATVRYTRRASGGAHKGTAGTRLRCAGGRRVAGELVERFVVSRAVRRAGRRFAANLAGRARITGTCGGAPAQLVVDWTAERTDLPERPTAGFTLGPDPVSLTLDGGVVRFSDTSVDDLDGGEIVGWSWDFGDGTTGEGRTVEHRYAALGTFRVRLTVMDDDGLSASVSDVVTVEP
jgi:hypothetical protein